MNNCETIQSILREIMENKEIVTYALIILGWLIVHHLSARRDKKKEWREFSRNTVDYLDKITDITLKYHMNDSRDKKRELEIIDFLDDLENRIELIRINLNLKTTISEFRDAVTMHNFQTAAFTTCEYGDSVIKKIVISSRELKTELYKAT